MTKNTLTPMVSLLACCALMTAVVSAQAPQPPQGAGRGTVAPAPGAAGAPAPQGGGRGGGGRGGGLPGATPEQTQAVADMNTALAAQTAAVTTARNELATATFADVKNEAGIRAAVEKLRVAELALATKRADEFAKLQAGPNKLNAEQVAALIAGGGAAGGGGRGGGGGGGGRAGAPGAPPAGAPAAPGGGRANTP